MSPDGRTLALALPPRTLRPSARHAPAAGRDPSSKEVRLCCTLPIRLQSQSCRPATSTPLCVICAHPERQSIEADRVAGCPFVLIARALVRMGSFDEGKCPVDIRWPTDRAPGDGRGTSRSRGRSAFLRTIASSGVAFAALDLISPRCRFGSKAAPFPLRTPAFSCDAPVAPPRVSLGLFRAAAPVHRWGTGPAHPRLGAPARGPCSDTSMRRPARWGCASHSADQRPPTSSSPSTSAPAHASEPPPARPSCVPYAIHMPSLLLKGMGGLRPSREIST
jgi:hypothetical protein